MKLGFFVPWYERLVENKMRSAAQAVAGMFFGLTLMVFMRTIPEPFNYLVGGLGFILLSAAVLSFAFVMIRDAVNAPPSGNAISNMRAPPLVANNAGNKPDGSGQLEAPKDQNLPLMTDRKKALKS